LLFEQILAKMGFSTISIDGRGEGDASSAADAFYCENVEFRKHADRQ
jgi:hypothetical protein